ncbi:hypothetical protein ALQ33_00319 [Pseudomonas syringae pv. philadelphi]|uniref:Proteinral secretion pathway protein GspM n=1 Tax=Pseudomonas syringae pv. philadelphi TaxID=251706 RepID=A0A3M3Z338_9PSED|nr:type II secretion system protein M [Pseudomonas syringae group genomosp. 3]RMO89016.1 hypothetical protein ALQ33_00319 [Pseudomonas syringae pv. philadelphi]
MTSRIWRQLAERWQWIRGHVRAVRAGLSQRDARLLSVGALALGTFLTWLWMVQPALKSVAYWKAEILILRTQAETLEVLLQEVALPRQPTDRQDLEQALRRSLETFGLLPFCQLKPYAEGDDRSWQVDFDQAPADAVMGWLLEQPQFFSLQIRDASLQRAGEVDAQGPAGHLSGVVRMDKAPSAKEAS